MAGSSGNGLLDFIAGLVILIGLFLIFREVVCWYWKINRMVELLESIEANLRNRSNSA